MVNVAEWISKLAFTQGDLGSIPGGAQKFSALYTWMSGVLSYLVRKNEKNATHTIYDQWRHYEQALSLKVIGVMVNLVMLSYPLQLL